MANIAAFLGAIAAAPLALGICIASADPLDPENGAPQRACLPHDGVEPALQQQFGEKIIGKGISADGTLIEIFMAPSGSFTVIKTSPQGTSCVVDSGESWQPVNQLESIGFTPQDLPGNL